jgi:hypothetical protein
MTRRALIPLSALLLAALAPATAAAAHKAKPKEPVVSSVSPKKVTVGTKLTVRGKNFLPGKGKTRVMFVRIGAKGVATAGADKASRTKLTVTVPSTLNVVLKGKSARFKLRLLTTVYGSWTPAKRSPVVYPGTGGSSGSSNPAADCDKDGVANGADADDDNDLLPDTTEAEIGTDPCKADSDGDGVDDGYEYQSALDLNRTVLFGETQPRPYPAKRPYPNALFPDAGVDFDGDGLTLSDEQLLWKKFGGHVFPLNYSDGLQTTVPTPAPTDPESQQMDASGGGPNWHDGMLDDGERDADGDGLTNWDEAHGHMTPDWWASEYDGKHLPKETPYTVSYGGTDMTDRDTDGDGIPDGLDDQDHDGLSNQFEVIRPYNWTDTYVSTGPANAHVPDISIANPWARVNPFNPCKPVWSKTCHSHPPFGYYGDDEDWMGMFPNDAATIVPLGVTPGPIFPS